jgi:PIN domain nuclease of toxin-antitoxin system
MNHDSIGVAMITCWAVALLAARNRIEIHGRVVEWWHDVMALPSTALLPLTIEIAATAATLPDPIRDPADRLIVATALHHGVPLVTKDSRIHHSGLVQTIW